MRWYRTEDKIKDYFDDKRKGHIDTREPHFKCENLDKDQGCDMGIDVMG